MLSKAATILGSSLLSGWLLKRPRSRDLTVLGLVFAAIALKQMVWLGDAVLELGRPEWLRISVVWVESLCIATAYAVLRFVR